MHTPQRPIGFLHARTLGPTLLDIALILVSPDGPDADAQSDIEVIAHTCARPPEAAQLLGDAFPPNTDLSPTRAALQEVLEALPSLSALYAHPMTRDAIKAVGLGISPLFFQATPLPAPDRFLHPSPVHNDDGPSLVLPAQHLLALHLFNAPRARLLDAQEIHALLRPDSLTHARALLCLAALSHDAHPLLRALPQSITLFDDDAPSPPSGPVANKIDAKALATLAVGDVSAVIASEPDLQAAQRQIDDMAQRRASSAPVAPSEPIAEPAPSEPSAEPAPIAEPAPLISAEPEIPAEPAPVAPSEPAAESAPPSEPIASKRGKKA